SFFHEPSIRCVPGRAALYRPARTSMKIMQPGKKADSALSASKAPLLYYFTEIGRRFYFHFLYSKCHISAPVSYESKSNCMAYLLSHVPAVLFKASWCRPYSHQALFLYRCSKSKNRDQTQPQWHGGLSLLARMRYQRC